MIITKTERFNDIMAICIYIIPKYAIQPIIKKHQIVNIFAISVLAYTVWRKAEYKSNPLQGWF